MRARERERDRGSKAVVRKRKRAGNPWWKDRAGICEGVPITFRIGDSPYILRIERATPIERSFYYSLPL